MRNVDVGMMTEEGVMYYVIGVSEDGDWTCDEYIDPEGIMENYADPDAIDGGFGDFVDRVPEAPEYSGPWLAIIKGGVVVPEPVPKITEWVIR